MFLVVLFGGTFLWAALLFLMGAGGGGDSPLRAAADGEL